MFQNILLLFLLSCLCPQPHSLLWAGNLPHPFVWCFWWEWSGRPPSLRVLVFYFSLKTHKKIYIKTYHICRSNYRAMLRLQFLQYIGHTLPGVLLGVFDELSDTLADLPGDNPDVFVELAFLCHLAIGALMMGISNFKILWMSFSNPNCAILSRFSHDL